MPACPEPACCSDGGYVSEGRGGVYLDRQLTEFASVVADMISDYRQRDREDLALRFLHRGSHRSRRRSQLSGPTLWC